MPSTQLHLSCMMSGNRDTSSAPDSEPLFSHIFTATGMNESSSNSFAAALCNVGIIITRLPPNSPSCLRMSLHVECEDNQPDDPATACQQVPRKQWLIQEFGRGGD